MSRSARAGGGREGGAVAELVESRKGDKKGLTTGAESKEPGAQAPRRVLEWNVESVTVGQGKKAKRIVNNIAGKTKSGELTALMGASGSGKTTLLHCLSLRSRNFEGAIQLDGKAPGGDYFTTAAFVHQQAMMFGFLTPREHLTFQAQARMSLKHSRAEITARVEEVRRGRRHEVEEAVMPLSSMVVDVLRPLFSFHSVMKSAQLDKCADTYIGGNDPIFREKGLSGGEQKRVAIATELLDCPDIILLDEPTSGLDSVMSEMIVDLLTELAKEGRIVIAVIHCPSSELMKNFTHLMLLTHDGRLGFHGPRTSAIPYFEKLGYTYPLDFNPADYLLKVLCCPPEYQPKAEEARMDALVKSYQASEWSVKKPLPCDETHKRFQRIRGQGASNWTLLKINSWRFVLQTSRDKLTFLLWGCLNGMIGTLLGLLFFGEASSNWRNLMGLCFSLATCIVVIGTLSNVLRVPMEWGPISREYFAGANHIGMYLIARYAFAIPYLYGPLILITIVYWMCGLDPSFMAYLGFTGIFLTTCTVSTALGQLASCISHNILVGLSILPAITTPMIMFSGLLYQRNTVPAWLSWIEDLSLVNYCFSALLIQQQHILKDGTGPLMLKFLAIKPGSLMHDVQMLWLICGVVVILNWLALTLRMRFTTEVL